MRRGGERKSPKEDPALAPYLGWHEWENHLDLEELETLATYRGKLRVNHSDQEESFWIRLMEFRQTLDFQQELRDAKGNPKLVAYAYFDTEIEAYPLSEEAKRAFSTLLSRVEVGKEIIITRRGKEVARLSAVSAARGRFPDLTAFRNSFTESQEGEEAPSETVIAMRSEYRN